jgi:hypothetical protein
MNVKEGMRRLALFLGAVGVIIGGFGSYAELQSILNQRERHDKFERLANSDVVQQERKCRLLGFYSGCFQLPPLPPGATLDKPGFTVEEPDGRPADSEVNKEGIKAIHWTKNYAVESIETEDGQTFYPAPAPNRWLYLLAAIFPLLGFALPWGLIRAVGWVGAGFSANPK